MTRLGGCALLVLAVLMLGCARPADELTTDQDQQLRDNLTRPLTAEEVSQMGGAQQGGAATAPQRE